MGARGRPRAVALYGTIAGEPPRRVLHEQPTTRAAIHAMLRAAADSTPTRRGRGTANSQVPYRSIPGWSAKITGMTATATAAARTTAWRIRSTWRMPWRSPEGQPAWARPTLLLLTVAAAGVYALGLRNGQLHGYYAPAVRSMSESWWAFFYGGYDPAASITLDKLPGAFQIQALSARIFGFSTFSVLLPQVIESALTVLVLYAVVRRWMGPAAGILAAAAFATTPIVAALAHAQISDTLLTLLLVLAAYAWQRAVDSGRLRWLLLSGVWVGLAFQTKMVQAWGVLPALALGYLIAARGSLWRRVGHVAMAGVVTFAVSMWWIVLMLLVPASSRPYIDGSTDNSPLSMVFDYNLFGRYGSGAQSGPGGPTGWSYMFGDGTAPQVGWLYPLALIGLVVGVWWRGRAPRTDVMRAGFLMWGLWFAVHAVAFSTGRVAHAFYVVAVAPAVAALAAGGLVMLWRAYRRGGWRRWFLPVAVASTVAWAGYLSSDTPTFMPWIRPAILALGLAGVVLLAAVGPVRRQRRRRHLAARMALAGGMLAAAAMLLPPTVWAASTVDSKYTGSPIGPAAGPAGEFGRGGGPVRMAFPGPGPGGRAGGPYAGPPGGQPPAGAQPFIDGPEPALGGPQAPGASDRPSEQTRQVIAYLKSHHPGSKYLLATLGKVPDAGEYILAGESVLPIGGFTGLAPSTTPTQMAKLVSEGKLRYVLVDGGDPGVVVGPGGGPGGFDTANSTAVREWVTSTCTAETDVAVSGLYDCAAD
jgi:4-amino-4-deoxy-L-arabinose transferase-like glycosyltransferase